jgi:hypothetical protein
MELQTLAEGCDTKGKQVQVLLMRIQASCCCSRCESWQGTQQGSAPWPGMGPPLQVVVVMRLSVFGTYVSGATRHVCRACALRMAGTSKKCADLPTRAAVGSWPAVEMTTHCACGMHAACRMRCNTALQRTRLQLRHSHGAPSRQACWQVAAAQRTGASVSGTRTLARS